jgi:hypothetical protein
MTKISLDPEQGEIQVTRSIGKNGDGKITINREGGGAIEINLGVISAGLTTDYGGGISLGIAGQEVTWEREGGTIHIGIGGFDVDVEARDCIVTEIKSIAGIIVAQRSYPDPGCRPPDPPDPPKPPKPDPINGIDPATITDIADGYVNIGNYYFNHVLTSTWEGSGTTTYEGTAIVDCSDIPEVVQRPEFYRSFKIPGTSEIIETSATDVRQIRGVTFTSTSGFTSIATEKRNSYFTAIDGVSFSYTYFGGETITSQYATGQFPPSTGGIVNGLVAFGSMRAIAKWVTQANQPFPGGRPRSGKLIINQVIPLGKRKPPPPFLPTGNKPPKMKECCEQILDYLADFEEAFEIKRLLKDKFPVSNSFMAPECDPTSVTRAKSYYEIIQCAFRVMAHGMIFEPRVNIKDADAAKAGDQEFKAKYLNATGWASAIAEALLEVKDDGNVSTNMDIRNGFAVTQTMVGLADAIYKLEVILDCLGIELIPKVETVETPYNLQIRIGKGFGENNERQIDLNTDEATEKLLPDMLRTQKNKIKTLDIHPRSRSLLEILENIEANLPGANGG